MQKFEDLLVWQKARKLVLIVYEATSAFPSEEKFGLTSQLRRAAVSVAANIAEGSERDGDGSFLNYLNIAKGSAGEVRCLLLLSIDLGHATSMDIQEHILLTDEIGRMIFGLQKKIKERL